VSGERAPDPALDGLARELAALNALRSAGDEGPRRSQLEALLDQRFGADTRLAVYGTLAPGAANHHLLAGVPGAWSPCVVRGQYDEHGWGLTRGYPGLRPDPAGPERAALLFASAELPRHWARLDAFEGAPYLRLLVPVRCAGGELCAANLYAVRAPSAPGGERSP
jgi:gamma-glutamylcyclotransferase (GGCT)/AIG2-like uncharacterized protein YtfP